MPENGNNQWTFTEQMNHNYMPKVSNITDQYVLFDSIFKKMCKPSNEL